VFQQAIERADPGLEAGDEVLVIDPHGKVLGRGLYSPRSAIAVRLYSREGGRRIDGALVAERIELAARRRRAQGLPSRSSGAYTTGYRLVHAEGDGLPGLIVDVYDRVAVVQLGTAGLRRLEGAVVDALVGVLEPTAILDRTGPAHDKEADKEGRPHAAGGDRVLYGEPQSTLRFAERGLLFELPLPLAQKTGFYFDQRPLRERIERLSRGCRVLDACCYVGPVALSAARGGASQVRAVDTSEPAILVGAHLVELNGLDGKVRFEVADAHKAFREAAADGGYDIVVCDPPKLSPNRRARGRALGNHRKLAAAACAATAPGGLLALCSCSASVDMMALQRSLALGARDAGRSAMIEDRCFQGPDHPVAAAFPEGLYLNVLIARIEAA
jgi:23S rRNA (cytosine1962-C5)-methyltransferase